MAQILDTNGNIITGTIALLKSYDTIRVSQQNVTAAIDLQIEGAGVLSLVTQLGGVRGATVSASDDGNTITGGSMNDRLLGGAGRDVLQGGDGDDYIIGQFSGVDTADDVLSGGAGRDQIYDVGGRANISAGTGDDKIYVGVSVTGGLVDGGGDWDVLGWSGRTDISDLTIRNMEVLETAGENITGTASQFSAFQRIVTFDTPADSLSPLTLTLAGAGTLNLTRLLGGQQAVTIFASDAGNTITGGSKDDGLYGGLGTDKLYGGAGADMLDGGAGNDALDGGEGNDTLDGGEGVDTMTGGTGNDTMYVDNENDVVREAIDGGNDAVFASVSYKLSSYIETLVLTGSDSIDGIGNAQANTLTGNDGNNTLDGGSGIDVMAGGRGDDAYVVSTAADIITELADEGTDIVLTAVSYTLGANLENLALTGTGNTSAFGNDLANILLGNSGNNVLNGLGGVDTMAGGLGNDSYYVDTAEDVVTEFDGAGRDIVYAASSYTLGANIENLTLTGASSTSATGNDLANVLVGNKAANVLDGGLGADSMSGGLGDDIYYVDNAGDTITEVSTGGIDLVFASTSYTMGLNVENLTMTGEGNLSATGNRSNNVLIGNAGNNVLDGGLGNDTLDGGNGNDVLIGGSGNDVLIGGAWADILMGGSGADVFQFMTASDSVIGNADTIADFAKGDKIDLSSVFSGLVFVGNQAFSGTAGELSSQPSLGMITVSADLDGDRIADFDLFVHTSQTILTAQDFIL